MENREAIERALELLPQMRDSEWITAVGQVTAIYTDEAKEVFNTAISALEKQEQDRWIPVTERLPEIKHHIDDEHFSDEVLVTEWFNGFKKTRIGNFDTRTGWWNDEKGCGFLGVITSWRPLPEPYTEEENDKPRKTGSDEQSGISGRIVQS